MDTRDFLEACTDAAVLSDAQALGVRRARMRAAVYLNGKCRKDHMRVLVHRAPALSEPLQQRWLANALEVLMRA